MKVTLFGYLCRDRNVLPDGTTSEIVGGKGLFSAAALAQSGATTELVTWLPLVDTDLLAALDPYGIQAQVVPMSIGTINTNVHHGDATMATTVLDPRPIGLADLTGEVRQAITSSDAVLLMPDIEEKISLEVIRYLSDALGLTVMADIGKFFRQLHPGGALIPRYPWPNQAEYLRSFASVFLSIEDVAPAMAAGESLLSLSRTMSNQGPAEVIITRGSVGASIFQRETNELIEVPAFPPRQLIDTTGAGDTFIGAYTAERLRTDDPPAAGRFAAMAASMKLAYVGPLRETWQQIEDRLKEHPV